MAGGSQDIDEAIVRGWRFVGTMTAGNSEIPQQNSQEKKGLRRRKTGCTRLELAHYEERRGYETGMMVYLFRYRVVATK